MTLLIGTTFLPLASSIDENKDQNIKILSNLTDYFNWMDYEGRDWTSPVKDQFFPVWCGSCWAFAALGMIESIINIREGIADLDVHLSVQYILSCLYGGSCDGGSDYRALKAIMDNSSRGNSCNGIIPEVCMSYQANSYVPCEEKSEDWEDYIVPLLDWGVFNCDKNSTEDRDIIKSLIMQYGSVTAHMDSTSSDYNKWQFYNHDPESYFSYEETNFIDHCVNLVGWKDDPNIERGGYWIVKNCFGKDVSYNGFHNLEYGTLNICNDFVTWVDYEPESYDWHPVPKINVINKDSYYGIYGLIDEPLEFTGKAAGEHPPFTFHWDFGDDTTSEEQNPSHTYTESGEYTIIFTVTDDNGGSFYDIKTAYIKETNQPPDKPILEGLTQIKKGESGNYTLGFSDPDGDILYVYVDNFGIESGVWWGPYNDITGFGLSTFDVEEGDYSIKAKVKDAYGSESDWAVLEVTVAKSRSTSDFNPWISRLIERFPILEFLL
jgi:C1A family cysteine protease